MEYSMADKFFFMLGSEKRVARVMFKRYRINRYELNLLACLSSYLQIYGKRVVSRKVFQDWCGFSYKAEKQTDKYFYGLVKKGLLKRLAYRRTEGNSLSLSPYGVFVLEDFYHEIELIDQATKDRKKKPGFRSLVIDNNDLPNGYILLDPGRDS